MQLSCTSHATLSQRKVEHCGKLEAGPEAEAVKACCLLACSLWLFPTYFITSSGTTSSRMPITPTQLARPCCTNHSIKCSTGLPTGHSSRDIFSVEVASGQRILVCIKLSKTRTLCSCILYEKYT